MEFLYLIIGFILLIKFADVFVDSSVKIAKYFNISEIIIGATIVSIGTTLPETMVSAVSAIKGHGDISYGNAIGSIICNTALVSAIPMIIAPGLVDKTALKNPTKFFYIAFVFYAIFAYVFGGFSRVAGIVLVSIFVVYIVLILRASPNDDKFVGASPDKEQPQTYSLVKDIVMIVLSAGVIAYASNLLVDNGVIIARMFNVPESVIGISLIALGTSLPELTTAITALVKGYSNLSIGNIIGADFMNLVSVTGVAAILGPFKIPAEKMINGFNSSLLVDVPVALISVTLLCIPPLILGKTKRWQGIILICIYISFMIFQYMH